MVLNARDAIALHMEWRLKFALSIHNEEPIDASNLHQIYHPDVCEIGRWLLSPELNYLRESEIHLDLDHAHVSFHFEMIKLATCISAGKYSEAYDLLQPGSTFQNASQSLANAILAFDSVLPLAINVDRKKKHGAPSLSLAS